MSIAITGATGQLGRLVITQLAARGATDLVALVRTPSRAADLGVPTRKADYDDEASLTEALAGIETLLLISSNQIGQRARQHRNVIAAAKAAGVSRIVYTSLLHADTSAITLLADEHLATEADVRASGLRFTILRNGWYTENYAASIPGAVQHGAFIGSAGDGLVSSATRADYAEAAAVVLTSEGHDGRTYELAGDVPYTLADLAAEISRQLGRTIPYRNLTEGDYAAALTAIGLPAPMAQAYANFDVGASVGALVDNGHQLSALIGRATTPLSVSVERALKG